MSDIDFTFWRHYDRENVQVLGINNGEDLQTTLTFINTFGLSFPVLEDPNSNVYWKFQMRGLTPYPRDIIIDEKGIIRYMHSEYDPQYMLETIDSLLVTDVNAFQTVQASPMAFQLSVFPNPFNGQMHLRFLLPDRQPVKLQIFTLNGQLLFHRVIQNRQPGAWVKQSFDFTPWSSGIYLVRLHSQSHSETKKVVLIK